MTSLCLTIAVPSFSGAVGRAACCKRGAGSNRRVGQLLGDAACQGDLCVAERCGWWEPATASSSWQQLVAASSSQKHPAAASVDGCCWQLLAAACSYQQRPTCSDQFLAILVQTCTRACLSIPCVPIPFHTLSDGGLAIPFHTFHTYPYLSIPFHTFSDRAARNLKRYGETWVTACRRGLAAPSNGQQQPAAAATLADAGLLLPVAGCCWLLLAAAGCH